MPEKIKNLPMVELQLANGSLYPEKGRIEAITGQIDPTTGTIQFRVGLPMPRNFKQRKQRNHQIPSTLR
jgi:membrane fusion protein (multidrug efflux system)